MEIDKQEGMAYLFILVIIVLLGSLGFSISRQAIIDNKIDENIALSKKAIYAAEAAVEYGRYIINIEKKIPEETPAGADYSSGHRFFRKKLGQDLYFELYFNNASNDNIEITGWGIHANHKEVVKVIVDKGGSRTFVY